MKTNPLVVQMVERFLRKNGYDGLFQPEGPCGCELGDIAPCGQIGGDCEAGYKVPGCNSDCGEGCGARLLPRQEVPHCLDCVPTLEEYDEYQALLAQAEEMES